MTAGEPSRSISEQLDQEIQMIPQEHLPNLLQIVRLFRESVTAKSVEQSADSLRQGWKEAILGQTLPIEQLWDGIDAK